MGDRRPVPGPTLAVKPGEVALYWFPSLLERDLVYRLPYRDLQATTLPARSRSRPCSPRNPTARWAAGPGLRADG